MVSFYESVGKRGVDLVAGAALLLLAAPLTLTVALVVRLGMGRPVLFRQLRPGQGGRPFRIVKFRTMRDDGSVDGEIQSDADRLPRIGRLIRSLSLDELPELINVLKGDMSLVGPRPLLMEYLPLYTSEQARRHEIRPGLTGWAQVHGRNALTWEERFALDVWYVDHVTFWLDLRILIMTVFSVLRREGISHSGHVTMQRFRGTHG